MDEIPTKTQIDFHSKLRRTGKLPPRVSKITIRLTQAEYGTMAVLADGIGLTPTEWAHEAVLRATKAERADPLFTEIVAMKMILAAMSSRLLVPEKMTLAVFHEEVQRIEGMKHKAAEQVSEQYAKQEAKG